MHIKPSTTIRQDYNGFSKFCHELDEPVLVAEKQLADSEQLVEHDEVIARMRRKINSAKD